MPPTRPCACLGALLLQAAPALPPLIEAQENLRAMASQRSLVSSPSISNPDMGAEEQELREDYQR